jgi:CarD family transcriptional regulator
VVRNLAIREHHKGLSTGEKQMFTRAKKILASELMYALEMDEEGAEQHLDNLLAESSSDDEGDSYFAATTFEPALSASSSSR